MIARVVPVWELPDHETSKALWIVNPVRRSGFVRQASASPPTQRIPALSNSGTGLCAENGSCYGDPNVNGVPKTVHVNGYYRRDGTYVRGYYRSAPGTNPPKR